MMTRSLFAALVLGGIASVPARAQSRAASAPAPNVQLSADVPAPRRAKPAHTQLQPHHATDHVRVKFQDGLVVRARDGRLTDFGTGALDLAQATLQRFGGGTWRRAHSVDEATLDRLRANARARLARHVADLNLQFDFVLPPDVTAEEAIDAFNALACVELADAAPLPAPAPTPPDFQPLQRSMRQAPTGLSAENAWSFPSGNGAGIRVCDVEYSYNPNHLDLPPVTVVGATVVDPFGNNQHGTAVLGAMGALPNGVGVTGMAHGATYFFAGANTVNGYHVDAAILAGVAALSPGDVITVEQQTFGPGGLLVPVEWDLTSYNAIVTAVGNGIVVVEAGANSGQDLDAPVFSQGNGGHWPFLPQNDSGAILVGAGATVLGTEVDRSRLSFSSFGSTVDLQGWGEHVVTAGFGPLYQADGPDQYYTDAFNGTSSAVPLVASACIDVQAAHVAHTGTALTPAQLRDVLRATGSPQQAGTNPVTQNIGPRPDITAAIQALGDAPAVTLCAGDTRATLCPCGNDAPASSGRGCLNSFSIGASLVATGNASLSNDTFHLLASSIGPSATMLFFQGTTSLSGTLFGDGLRCVNGGVVRLGTVTADSLGTAVYPAGAQLPVSVRGQIAGPGLRSYQTWYRNSATFCSTSTFNFTSSLTTQWVP